MPKIMRSLGFLQKIREFPTKKTRWFRISSWVSRTTPH